MDWSGAANNAFNKATNRNVLAEIACMSSRNFQLYFKAYLEEPFGKYIDRVRRELALQLIIEGKLTYAEIADRIGFANDTALYNTFQKKLRHTPSDYKAKLTRCSNIVTNKIECEIQEIKKFSVIFLSYIGNYDEFSSSVFEKESWDKLYSFACSLNILPETEDYWGICYDNREITDSDKCRFYACLSISHPIKTMVTDEIKCMIVPSTVYAVFTHVGSYDNLDCFYDIAIQNIPVGYVLSDELILEQYRNSPVDTSESELITKLWIPIKKE